MIVFYAANVVSSNLRTYTTVWFIIIDIICASTKILVDLSRRRDNCGRSKRRTVSWRHICIRMRPSLYRLFLCPILGTTLDFFVFAQWRRTYWYWFAMVCHLFSSVMSVHRRWPLGKKPVRTNKRVRKNILLLLVLFYYYWHLRSRCHGLWRIDIGTHGRYYKPCTKDAHNRPRQGVNNPKTIRELTISAGSLQRHYNRIR